MIALFTIAASLAPAAVARPPDDPKAPAPGERTIVFEDVAARAGIAFRFETGSRGKHDLPEIMGGGVAILDADGDGRLDIYLCNGGPIGAEAGKPDPPCRLYRNKSLFRKGAGSVGQAFQPDSEALREAGKPDLREDRTPKPPFGTDSNGGWQFEDITDRAGAPGPSYAMGAAVGDYDGDGRVDLFVTGWRDQRLYRNLGGGRFEDVTRRAGLTSDDWSTSAAFADLDGDGDLDLYVATYLVYDADAAPFCAAPDGRRDYCGPEDFRAQPDHLYRNNGDGTFTDVAESAGIDLPEGRGLGVLIAELTGDHRPDIYVANDSSPCWLFANRGGLRFEEIGEGSGVARDGDGQVLSGMGVAHGDLDGDGLLDLAVANFHERSTIAFRAQGTPRGVFLDATTWLGLKAATRHVLGFGLVLVDLDGDGRVDLLQTNGHVLDRGRLGTPFAMRPTLLRNAGIPLRDASASAGPWFERAVLGRGLAVGDLDDDGRPDAVAAALDAPASVLRNASKGGHHLGIDLVDRAGRPAYGARVRVIAGGRIAVGSLDAGGSYLAAGQPRLWFGLGPGPATVARIEVDWPWGSSEGWDRPSIPPRGAIRLRQGTGRAIR